MAWWLVASWYTPAGIASLTEVQPVASTKAHLETAARTLLCCWQKQVGRIIHKGCSLEVVGQATHALQCSGSDGDGSPCCRHRPGHCFWGRLRAYARFNLTNGQPPYPTFWREAGDILAISNNMASQFGPQNPGHGGAKMSGDPVLCCEALGTQDGLATSVPIRNAAQGCPSCFCYLRIFSTTQRFSHPGDCWWFDFTV